MKRTIRIHMQKSSLCPCFCGETRKRSNLYHLLASWPNDQQEHRVLCLWNKIIIISYKTFLGSLFYRAWRSEGALGDRLRDQA